MSEQIYKVRDPEGNIREIRGPAGATNEQVIAKAQELFAKPNPFASLPTNIKSVGPLETNLPGTQQIDQFEQGAYEIGGKVTDLASKVLPPEGAAALGMVANVGIQSVPMLLGGTQAKAAAPVIRNAAEGTMQSALKPTLSNLQNGNAARAISTLLDEGLNATKGGAEKLKVLIADLNKQVVEAIKASPATVNKNKAASELIGTIKRFEKQVDSKADIAAIENVWANFLSHPLLAGKSEIPVQLAQELKQGTYQTLAKKYGQLGSAEVEAQKAIARGLKEGISEAVPGVAQLNARESALINALQQTERRALMDGNKNLTGLALLANHPATFAAFMADKSAAFKSIVARMLNAGKEQIPATGARLGIVGTQTATSETE
jgi:hypothetical protein